MIEQPSDRKGLREANAHIGSLKKRSEALTSERDEVLVYYQHHNAPKTPKPVPVHESEQPEFDAISYAARRFEAAKEDIRHGWGRDEESEPGLPTYLAYYKIFSSIDEESCRPEPLNEAEFEEGCRVFKNLVEEHLGKR